MKRIFATYIKEWQLIRRDLGGLALLFLMPVLLITIMALVQDAPFKDYKDLKFEALFLNQDKGKVSQSIKEGLLKSGQFILIESIDQKPLDLNLTRKLVQDGSYKLAIVIPAGTTAEIVNSANQIANEIGKKVGIPGSLPHRESRDSLSIDVMFDPVSKPTFRVAILNAIDKFTTRIQADIVLERIGKLNGGEGEGQDTSFNFEEKLHALSVKEVSSQQQKQKISMMNSVQHNVPAWAIFGMFFMIILICENIINERTQGSWTRLKLIPGSFSHILIGKMLFYVLLGIIQFYLMLMVGVYLMPYIGLPSLHLSETPFLLLIMVWSIAMCATTFGILVGTVFKTTQQALPVAAMSVVILSAVGGVWVPVEVLPSILKNISLISPMRWGLQGINNLLLRESCWQDILQPVSILLGGSVITMVLAWWVENRRKG
ncbi:MAG: ABC transporter permease [Chitinophagaceae bacterium]|nr:ABC transporter permease [Chitinophagaceae bacterium]